MKKQYMMPMTAIVSVKTDSLLGTISNPHETLGDTGVQLSRDGYIFDDEEETSSASGQSYSVWE